MRFACKCLQVPASLCRDAQRLRRHGHQEDEEDEGAGPLGKEELYAGQ